MKAIEGNLLELEAEQNISIDKAAKQYYQNIKPSYYNK